MCRAFKAASRPAGNSFRRRAMFFPRFFPPLLPRFAWVSFGAAENLPLATHCPSGLLDLCVRIHTLDAKRHRSREQKDLGVEIIEAEIRSAQHKVWLEAARLVLTDNEPIAIARHLREQAERTIRPKA